MYQAEPSQHNIESKYLVQLPHTNKMTKVSYETQAYSPACFDTLRYLEDAQKELESRNLTREGLRPVRSVLSESFVSFL